MNIENKEKAFDAVKMMYQNRDKISFEKQQMSLKELKAYLKSKLGESNKKIYWADAITNYVR